MSKSANTGTKQPKVRQRKQKPAASKKDADTGRPTKYTPERIKKLLEMIGQGNFKTVAARACGITSETLSQWEKHKPGFSESIKEAEAKAEAGNVKNIYNASKSQWTASAWFLERKNNERWGKKEKHEVSGHLLEGTPEDIKKAVVEMYKSNPEIWEDIKREVEDDG